MTQMDTNDWKTPLGYYERAIAELRRAREEMRAEVQNLKAMEASLGELQTLKKDWEKSQIEILSLREELESTKKQLATAEKTAERERTKLQSFKERLQDLQERFMQDASKQDNERFFKELSQINEQLSKIQSQYQPKPIEEGFQTQIFQSLSDLRSLVSKLADELMLVSAASGTDYTPLRDLLAAREWQKADEKTRTFILALSNREKEGWLDRRHIIDLPWQDLRLINRLWVEYSEGRFGYSVQKQIWQSVKVPNNDHFEAEMSLGSRVGWRERERWLPYSEFNFDFQTAPCGHLPSTPCLMKMGEGKLEARLMLFYSRPDLPA